MPVFMAGAITMGARAAMTVVVSMSSAMPAAVLPMKLAVAGAMTNRSARWAKETCFTFHSPGSSNMSTVTGLAVSVRKVRGVTNSHADSVMITCTSSPRRTSMLAASVALAAAMPPVTPNTHVSPTRGHLPPESPPSCVKRSAAAPSPHRPMGASSTVSSTSPGAGR